MAPAHPEPPSLQPDEVDFFCPEEVDPELLRLEKRPSVLQLLLTLVVMVFALFVGWIFRLEVAYFFADDDPVDIGPIEDLALPLQNHPSYLLQFGSNIYAHLSGIPHRRSASPTKQYHQLVGAPVFIEEPREDADPLLRDIRIQRPALETRRPREYVDASGRFLRFDDLGRRQQGVIEYYETHYNLRFCNRPLNRTQQQFMRHLREELRPQLEAQLSRPPTETQLERAAEEEFPCQHGFLFQVGRAPADHGWYLVLFGFLLLVELAGLFFITRWVKKLWIAIHV